MSFLPTLFISLAAATALSVNECLYELYTMTDGPNWYAAAGWESIASEAGDPCLAYGIDCDLNNTVIGISLPGNNLFGELPKCLAEIYTMKELSLPSNRIKGTLANLPLNLTKISMSMTSITGINSSICRLMDLQSFSVSYCDLSNVTIPMCLYKVPHLSIMGTGVRLPQDLTTLTITSERKGLSIPGINASALTLELPFEETRNLTTLDLSNTHISGVYNLSQLVLTFPRVQDLYLGGNNLTGWLDFSAFKKPPPFSIFRTKTINLGLNNFKAIITGIKEIDALISNMASPLYGIDFSNNKILGISPTNEELQRLLFKHKEFYILNLENNTFLCTDERTSLFDCIPLKIESVLVINSTTEDARDLRIGISLPDNIPADLATEFVSNLQLKIKLPGSDDGQFSIYPIVLRNTFYDLQKNRTELNTLVTNIPIDYDPINQPFKLYWKHENLTLKLQMNNYSPFEVQQAHNSYQDIDTPIPKLILDIYGMSRCPYFAKIMIEDIKYLLDTYPKASEILTIRFSSLMKPSIYNVCGGYSSHGAAEVTGDYYLLCLQNHTSYNSTIMRDFYSCVYGSKGSVSGIPYNITRCSTKILKQAYNFTSDDIDAITKCSRSHVNPLISLNFGRVLNNSIGFSPTMYLDENLFCIQGLKCTFDDSSNHLSVRVANMMEKLCSIYAEKYGEYINCTQKSGNTAQCPKDEIVFGSQCASQRKIVIIVSTSCVSFLLCLVLVLMTYSRIKEVREKNRSTANVHSDRRHLLLTDSEGSGSDAEVV